MSLPYPFVWHDVALVHILAALPLGGLLAAEIRTRCSTFVALFICGMSFGGGLLITLAATTSDAPQGALKSLLVRSLTTLALALSAALAVGILRNKPEIPGKSQSIWRTAAFVVGVLVLLLAPLVYVRARVHHDLNQLAGLIEQSRYGEARDLARAILLLEPEAKLADVQLSKAVESIEKTTAMLESRVARKIPETANSALRLDHAFDLAMLARTSEALAVLDSFPESQALPEALALRATLYETRLEYKTARDTYRRAKASWDSHADERARLAGLRQCVKGIAYCERSLGRNAQAEAAYLELLALSPSADAHFLLAEFYDHTQRAALARKHARLAIELDRGRYEREGNRLIDKLATSHFGCLGVFAAERDVNTPPKNARQAQRHPLLPSTSP